MGVSGGGAARNTHTPHLSKTEVKIKPRLAYVLMVEVYYYLVVPLLFGLIYAMFVLGKCPIKLNQGREFFFSVRNILVISRRQRL